MGIFKTVLTDCIYILAGISVIKAEVILTHSPDNVFEDTTVTLTCQYTGVLDVNGYEWRRNGASVGALVYDATSGCTPFTEPDTTQYTYSCPERNRVILIILQVTQNNNGDDWNCQFILGPDNSRLPSNMYTILVHVPVTSVAITQPTSTTVSIQENTDQVFKCRTSTSRPTATIQWYLDDGTSSAYTRIKDNIQQTPAANVNELKAVTGTLTYRPTRQVNGWQLYCSAQTIKSSTKVLSITYPPNSTRIDNYVKDSTYSMIAGKQQTLTCRSIDGNPLATLRWSCFTGTNSDSVSGTTVTSVRTWTTHTGGQCRCISEHIHGTQSYSLNVEILVAVNDVKFHVSNQEVSDNVKVIADSTAPIVCSASGSPTVTYKWKHGTMEVTGNSLYPSNILQDGTYTCHASNTLNPSQGQPEPHNSSLSVDITRLYKPSVDTLPDVTLEEGNSQIPPVVCQVTPGNPQQTNIKWTRNSGVPISSRNRVTSLELPLNNVNRNQDGAYTCIAENTMDPSKGQTEIGRDSKHFQLTVHYKASIEQFTVEGQNNEVTVDELASPLLACSVNSNPASNIEVLFRDQTLAEVSSTLQLTHQLSNVSCGDIGVYTCSGRNYLNTQTPSTQDVVLLVKCRPQPYGDIAYTIHSAQQSLVTLHMSVLAYPVSPSVIWKKDEIELKNNAKLTITVNNVESTETYNDIIQLYLIIHNVTKTDFGEYKVQISNGVGVLEKTFLLKSEENVKPPEGKTGNVGMVVGGFVGGVVFAGLVAIAVVFVIRRHRSTCDEQNKDSDTELKRRNHHDDDDTNKPSEDVSYNNIGRGVQMTGQSNNEAVVDKNDGSAVEYEELNNQRKDVTTYSSLQPVCGNPTNVDTSDENKTYENLQLRVV